MTTTPTTRPRSAPPSRPCASSSPARLIAVFQPHLYSRTKALAEEFGAALALADEVVVLDVYPAREQPVGELAGVSGLRVAQAAAERSGGRPVWWLPDADSARRALAERLDQATPAAAAVSAAPATRSWSRSAPATSSSSARRWSRRRRERAARRGPAPTTRWPA